MTLGSKWRRCRGYLLPSLEQCHGTYSEQDLVDGIVDGSYQLFEGQKSAVLTTILCYPRTRAIHFFLAGGDLKELKEMETEIVSWAKAEGCDRAEFSGRRGWIRALTDYQELCTVGFKEI